MPDPWIRNVSGIAGNIATINFDRPFLLILEDTATRTPLFLARVADPTQA
jgi:serine protease inhibitor